MRFRLFFLMLLLTFGAGRPAAAMPILQFARMNLDDQAEYVSRLVEGAAKLLRAKGHADQADKAVALFKDPSAHGGLHDLARTAAHMQGENDLMATNPNNRLPVRDVEDAMQATLSDNGIEVPATYLRTLTRDFAPSFPPRSHIGGA